MYDYTDLEDEGELDLEDWDEGFDDGEDEDELYFEEEDEGDFYAFDEDGEDLDEFDDVDLESDFDFDGEAFEEYETEDGGDALSRRRRRRRRRFRKFFRKARNLVKKVGRVAKKSARAVGTAIGGAVAGPAGARIGGKVGGVISDLEDEDGYDSPDEMDATIEVPQDDEDMAEAMAAIASRCKPSDAQALGGALAVTIMARTPLKIKRLEPTISAAAGRAARVLASKPATKPLVATLPTVVKKTAATLKKKAAKGKTPTPRTAARVMAKQAKRTLSSTPKLTKALAGNMAKRRRLNAKAIARAEKFY